MKSSLSKITESSTPVLIDFFATWCGPCQAMIPILKQVKSELGDQVRIVKVDVDKNPAVASQFKVRGVPTFILFKEGQPLWRQSGIISKADLIKTISKYHN
ncbi:MAG: thioredoxin [Leeuwenhoekiella sp.]